MRLLPLVVVAVGAAVLRRRRPQAPADLWQRAAAEADRTEPTRTP